MQDGEGQNRDNAPWIYSPPNLGCTLMEIKVNFLDNLRLEAKFDDFTVIADQPIRYKGDGSAPSPFDYFLASSALCAAYFVKVYCKARDIPPVNGPQNASAILVGEVLGQLHMNPEDLVIAVFRVDNIVLRQADIIRGDIPGLAVHLHEIGGTQG